MQTQSSLLNCTQKDSLTLMSSSHQGWQGIFLEFHSRPPFETPEIYHPEYIITIPTHYVSSVEEVVDGKVQTSPSRLGDVTVAPPEFRRQYRWKQNIELIHLILEPTLINHVAREAVESDCVELIPHFKKFDLLIYQIGLALKAELATNPLNSSLYAESAIALLAVHLLRHYSVCQPHLKEYAGGLPQPKLKQAIDYIQTHLEEDISLDAIAACVGMSRYYFCRLFKQSTGLSPYQYVIQQRVKRAKQLLRQGKVNLTDVAIACGFDHSSHLYRHFKRLTGVSPKTFLNS